MFDLVHQQCIVRKTVDLAMKMVSYFLKNPCFACWLRRAGILSEIWCRELTIHSCLAFRVSIASPLRWTVSESTRAITCFQTKTNPWTIEIAAPISSFVSQSVSGNSDLTMISQHGIFESNNAILFSRSLAYVRYIQSLIEYVCFLDLYTRYILNYLIDWFFIFSCSSFARWFAFVLFGESGMRDQWCVPEVCIQTNFGIPLERISWCSSNNPSNFIIDLSWTIFKLKWQETDL